MTKDEYFKLCTALVQEQVYAWGIASSFVCLGSPPGMADAMLLKPNWSILKQFLHSSDCLMCLQLGFMQVVLFAGLNITIYSLWAK